MSKKDFKRKKRSPFGIVSEVFSDVKKEMPVKSLPAELALDKDVKKVTKKTESKKSLSIDLKTIDKKAKNTSFTVENLDKKSDDPLSHLNSIIDYSSKKDKLSNGFLMVPNSLLMDLLQPDMSKLDLGVILSICRLTIGFQKKETQISAGVICNMLGLKTGSKTRIFGSIKKLVEKKILIKTKMVDAPNIIGIHPDYTSDLPSVADRLSNNVVKSLAFEKVNNKTIDNYIDSIKAPSKKKSEYSALKTLMGSIDLIKIEAALDYIKKNGDLSKKETVHSPFKYLTSAIDDVLANIDTYDKHVSNLREKQKVELEFKNTALKIQLEQESKINEVTSIIKHGLEAKYNETNLKQRLRELFEDKCKTNKMLKTVGFDKIELQLKADLAESDGIIDSSQRSFLSY